MPSGHTATAASHNGAPRPPEDTDHVARARSERKVKLAASRARTAAVAAAAATVAAARGGGGGGVGASSGGAANNDALKKMRKLRNRESAAASRQRVRSRVADLEIRIRVLKEDNRRLRQVIRCNESAELGERHGGVDDCGGCGGGGDDGDDGCGDVSLPSETAGNPSLWTPAAAASACSATGYRTAEATGTGAGVGGWWAPQSGGGDDVNFEEAMDYLCAELTAAESDITFAELAAKDRAGHI